MVENDDLFTEASNHDHCDTLSHDNIYFNTKNGEIIKIIILRAKKIPNLQICRNCKFLSSMCSQTS